MDWEPIKNDGRSGTFGRRWYHRLFKEVDRRTRLFFGTALFFLIFGFYFLSSDVPSPDYFDSDDAVSGAAVALPGRWLSLSEQIAVQPEDLLFIQEHIRKEFPTAVPTDIYRFLGPKVYSPVSQGRPFRVVNLKSLPQDPSLYSRLGDGTFQLVVNENFISYPGKLTMLTLPTLRDPDAPVGASFAGGPSAPIDAEYSVAGLVWKDEASGYRHMMWEPVREVQEVVHTINVEVTLPPDTAAFVAGAALSRSGKILSKVSVDRAGTVLSASSDGIELKIPDSASTQFVVSNSVQLLENDSLVLWATYLLADDPPPP